MMHPACEAKLPLNAQAGKCTADGCFNFTSSKVMKLCTSCSAENGKCQVCARTLVKRETRTAITGGGCMNPRGQAVVAANSYFPTVPGYVKHEINGDVITVTVDGELPTVSAKRFWLIFKVVYVSANQPVVVEPVAKVVFVFKGNTPAGQQKRVLDAVKRLPGVVSVTQVYPNGENPRLPGWNPYFERFYDVGLSDAKVADDTVAAVKDYSAVEEAQVDPLAQYKK